MEPMFTTRYLFPLEYEIYQSITFISVDITSSQVNNLNISKPRCQNLTEKKPLHMTQASNDDDSSKGTAAHTNKKNNFCSHFQFPIYKIQFKKTETHFHDIHTF